jgi:hypothetical protein
MTSRRALGALVMVAAVASSGVSSAAPRRTSGLHDARYCEIIEIKGAPPHATATVWNTIKLNRCPAAKWKAFDAAALARELGDTAVVLNGPRHFLMDSVTGKAGRVHSFHGLGMRKVATLRIRTAAELTPTPYSDRTINRRNTWRWERGRRVYELVAPGGDVYVMQSYAQIRDPKLTIRKLRSLGRRLDLPYGWRYRMRRLSRALTLRAKGGKATVLQDDLLNTYQLARTVHRRGKRKRHRVRIKGATHTVPPATPGTIEDHGKVTGKPFGRGSITLVGTFRGARLTGTFRLVYRRGSVSGTVSMPFTIGGGKISFRGTARFTAGTGAYRGISGGKLRVHDTNTLDGKNGRLSVRGFATY